MVAGRVGIGAIERAAEDNVRFYPLRGVVLDVALEPVAKWQPGTRDPVRPPAPSVATSIRPHARRPSLNPPLRDRRTRRPPIVTFTEPDAWSARSCQLESSESTRSVNTFITFGGTGYGGTSNAYWVRQPYTK